MVKYIHGLFKKILLVIINPWNLRIKEGEDYLVFSESTFGDYFQILRNSQRIIYTISVYRVITVFEKRSVILFVGYSSY